jgi:hypothetical protein
MPVGAPGAEDELIRSAPGSLAERLRGNILGTGNRTLPNASPRASDSSLAVW